MTKTQFAFECSAHKLFEASDDVYFWTFTFVKVMPDWCYGYTWQRFRKAIEDLIEGNLSGIRIIEPHKQHGLHFHALINRRLPVRMVRRIAKRYGFGRIHVKKADSGAVGYLSKYLTKQFTKETKLHAGLRRWQAFGAVPRTRVRDIEVDSPVARHARRIKESRGRAINFREFCALRAMYGRT